MSDQSKTTAPSSVILHGAKRRDPYVARLEAALAWYGENARLARLIHKEGDAGRHALADDGGKLAREVLGK